MGDESAKEHANVSSASAVISSHPTVRDKTELFVLPTNMTCSDTEATGLKDGARAETVEGG